MSNVELMTCKRCWFQWRVELGKVCYKCLANEQRAKVDRLTAKLAAEKVNNPMNAGGMS